MALQESLEAYLAGMFEDTQLGPIMQDESPYVNPYDLTRWRTNLCLSTKASKGRTIAPTPCFSWNNWSYHFSLFCPFNIASEHITMVLGRDPKIEVARKSANASAKSMSKRGTRNAPPNHPPHQRPQTRTKKRKQK
jgi:hypothetical protein